MTEFVIKALNYGVLGLCAVMLVAVWRVLVNEQGREADPRPGIIHFAYVFMGFCFALAALNAYVQLTGSSSVELVHHRELVQDYTRRLDREREKLGDILTLLSTDPESKIESADPAEKARLKGIIERIRIAAKEAQAADPQ